MIHCGKELRGKTRTKKFMVSSAESLLELSFWSMQTTDWQFFLSVLSFSFYYLFSTSSNKGLFLNLGKSVDKFGLNHFEWVLLQACTSTVVTNMSQLLLLFCIASTSFSQKLTAMQQENLHSVFHDLFSVGPAYLLRALASSYQA